MSAAYAILTKNRCVFGGRAGTSLMVCSQTPVSTVTPEAGLAGQLFCKGGDKVMKKAVRKGASKAAALVLSLAMIFGMVPMVGASAEETAGAQDNFDRIVHLDMGRKYFTPEWIKSLIDEMAKLGYNQLELDFGNSEAGQLRFALKDMSVTYTYDEYTMVPVDSVSEEEPAAPAETGVPEEEPAETGAPEEEPAAPAETGAPEEEPAAPAETGAPEEEPAAPVSDEVLEQAETNGNGSGVIEYRYINEPVGVTIDLGEALPAVGEYITEEQMADIITYAKEKDIEIVPLLNSPGHFGAVLCAADAARKNYRYQRYDQGTNSLNIADPEARAFGLAVVEKYAKWFKEKGCDTFNIGADEFANDSGIMGFNEFGDAMWSYFDSYINGLYDMLTGLGYTTVRMFNDGVNYGGRTGNISKDIQICYWSSGWDGYNVAYASKLASQGYSLINTNGAYYFVLKDGTMKYRSEEECLSFANESFMGGTVSSSAGSMFCIWCDEPDNASQEEIMEAVKGPMTAVAYQMQGGASGTGLSYEQFKLSAVDSLTDRATGVTVSVDGLKTVKVEKQEKVDALENNALYSDYVAYNITLNGGEYTEAAAVTIPLEGTGLNGVSESLLRGFVVNQDGSVKTAEGTLSGTDFTFTAPHFSTVGVAALNENLTEETITLVLGGSETVKVDGVNLGDEEYTIEDIVSVTVKGKDGTSGTVDYVKAENVRCEALISSNSSEWRPTGYYYKATDGNYYPLYAKRSSESQVIWTKYTYTWGYSTTASANDVTLIQSQENEFFNRNPAVNITIYTRRDVPGTEASTTITFTGVSEGTTSVVIGETRYVINVTKEDLSRVDPLTVEYWITNARVTGDTSHSETIQIEAEQVYGENGVDLSTLVDANGLWDEQPVVLWKTTVLDYNNHQSGDSGDDETADGNDFTRIRYWKDNWQYYYNGNWQNITTSGYRVDQVVAYYLQQTDVTTEVTTFTKDWGYDTTATTPDTSSHKGQVALAFAVVYPDGTMNPANEDLIYDKATIFNYWDGRNFGIVSVQNNSDYTVSKITITEGTRAENTSKNVWYPSDTINWEKKRLDNGSYWYNETTAWDKSQGGVPTVYGNGYEWTRKNQATLVLIYLEPTQSEDDLTVNYIVEGNSTPFYTFPVKVTNTTGQEEKTFLNSLVNNNKPVQVGSIELDDAAYVTNSSGVNQTFNKNLTTVPALQDTIYGSGLFTYTGAEISQDGKTLTLIYKKNSTSQYQYVLDFGLPVTVPLSELGINPQGVTTVTGTASYGEISYNAGSQSITYTPNSILKTTATAQLIITFGDGAQQKVTVDFIPASTVYYEAEGFVKSTNGTWQTAGTPGNRTQAADKLGDPNANNYGSDTSYDSNALGSSNGAALMTEVTPTAGTGEDIWPEATFTFTGTGVDIISQTDSASTWLLVEVKNDKSEPECAYLVNNYYSAKNDGVNTIYQVPVIKVQGLACDTYNVTVKPFYDTNDKKLLAVEGQTATEFNFYLDAIRVYNPLENGNTYYGQDGEANAQFINLSKYVDSSTTGLWVDKNIGANVNIYKDDGPNNEIYLASGQSVTIKLVDSEGKPIETTDKSAQIGARLISGTENVAISVDGTSITVDSTVDQYYEVGSVGQTFTITNTGSGSGIVALTTLKLTDGSN